jgi:diaminopimelate epimerase
MVVDTPTQGGDFRMRFFNSDGSMGEMCGNGARCICRYGYENGLSGQTQTIETTAGIVTGRRISPRNYRIRLNDPSVVRLDCPVEVDGTVIPCSYVELGNPGLPHAVVPWNHLREADENALRELGRKLRWHKDFPKGANVNFFELQPDGTIYERTFERGVEDFTYACGTGTGSVAAVLTLKGLTAPEHIQVDMVGGRLTMDVETGGGKVTALHLTGPTNIVCKGEVTDEELHL